MKFLLNGAPVEKIELEHKTVDPDPDGHGEVPGDPIILVNGVRVLNYTILAFGDDITEAITVPYPEGERTMNTETKLTTEQAHQIVADAVHEQGWTTEVSDSDQAKAFRFDQAMRLTTIPGSRLHRALDHLAAHVYSTENRSAADTAVDLTAEYQRMRDELVQAIVHTAEYVDRTILPAIPGWSWYDALLKYAPEEAARFENPPTTSNQQVCFRVTSEDEELATIEIVSSALRDLKSDARGRVIRWAASKYGEES